MHRTRVVRRRGIALAALLALMAAGCTDSGDEDAASGATTTTTTEANRLGGPVADMSEELTGGDGVFIGSAVPAALDDGYVEVEYVAAGTATSYAAVGDLGSDGRWTLQADETADYRTRVLVRRPAQAGDFSGVVLMEWLNVSGGIDADPGFTMLSEEIQRQGHAWVGVSTQLIGVEGGEVAVRVDVPEAADVVGQGLTRIDAARYGSLVHPGDGFAYDIFTQVARGLREGGAPLGDLEPSHLLALGQSQSAFALVTYVNGVQPLTRAFDGFFVHSRGGAALPLGEAGKSADLTSAIGGAPAIFRTDTDVPILDVQTENDIVSVIGSAAARPRDSDTFRLWEVAGTAHADLRLVGDATAAAVDCGVPINDGPMHVVAKAALRRLVAWVRDGDLPPDAPRLELTEGDTGEIRRSDDGIALGGVRTPPVDVPVRVLSGEPGPAGSVICLLLGSTRPLPEDRLAQLYPTRSDYELSYERAVDDAISDGFVLDDDRAALEAYAHPELVQG